MSNYPSLSDIIKALEELDVPKNSDRARAKDKLLDRLTALRDSLPGLNVQKSRNVHKLFGGRSVILDISNVSDIAYPVLFAFMNMHRREAFRSDDPSEIIRMEIVEEAHEPLGGYVDKRTSDLKEGEASGILRDLRKTETCGVVVSQLIRDLSQSVRGNLGTVFTLRQGDGPCVSQAAAALNLQPHQVSEVAKLPNQHAIARFSRYGKPVYIKIKDAGPLLSKMRKLSREEAKERSHQVLESIPFVKRVEQPVKNDDKPEDSSEQGLHPEQLKVFAHLSRQPWSLTPDRLDDTGLSRDKESRIRNKLELSGLIKPTGKVGAKYCLFEPTDRGKELATKMDLQIGETGKGGLIHRAIIHYTRESLQRYSPELRFWEEGSSATTGRVQPDLLAILSDGKRVPIQACCGNKVSYEAEAFLRLHQLTQVDDSNANKVNFVIGVAVNKGHRAVVERVIRRKNDDKMPGKLIVLDFDTVYSGFDWSRIFEDMD